MPTIVQDSMNVADCEGGDLNLDIQPSVVCDWRLGHPPIASDDRDFALKPCGWGHRWEELDNHGYAGAKGVLKERSCYLCRLRFVDGKIYPEVKGETWKPGFGKKLASHCINCDICACKICRCTMPKRQAVVYNS